MKSDTNPVKYILACLGFLVLFSMPIVAVLAMWDFKPSNIKNELIDMFNPSNKSGNYNFEIPAGEDALLTSNILNESRDITITPRSNPATLVIIAYAAIEGPVVYGTDGEALLRQGFWHHPASVYPGEQGVSVIFGHRRYHLPPAKDTFYNLDKVNIGERVEISLSDGTWLEYTVIETKIINPDEINNEINEQTDKYIVKFVTCTPLGTSSQRLVVVCERVL
ncbi:sortase [Candidatus Dojkabacteria bacterium]|nr:sortase [Candidatus Dojkabacteria bacterium]